MRITIERLSIERAADLFNEDIRDFRASGWSKKRAYHDAVAWLDLRFTADLMHFDGCSLEVAEARAADLVAATLAYENQPADDNQGDRLLDWLRQQMSEPEL